MAKRTIACRGEEKRFTVLRVHGSVHDRPWQDVHAGRSFEEALAKAQPDRGQRLSVYATCARDVEEARHTAIERGQLLRTMRVKR